MINENINKNKIKNFIFMGFIGDIYGLNLDYNNHQINKLNNNNFNTEKNKNSYLSQMRIIKFMGYNGFYGSHYINLSFNINSIINISNLHTFTSNYNYDNFINTYIKNLKLYYLNDSNYFLNNEIDNNDYYKLFVREFTDKIFINNLNNYNNNKYLKYDTNATNYIISTNFMIFGLFFNKSNDKNTLINLIIDICMLLYPNGKSICSGITCAMFTHFALNNIRYNQWFPEIINILQNNNIDNHIKNKYNYFYDYFLKDKNLFIENINNYLTKRYTDGVFMKQKHLELPNNRIEFYYDLFNYKDIYLPGLHCDDCIFIAFDCLVESQNNFELLIYYTLLHNYNSSPVAFLAMSWYGLIYGGDNNISKNFMDKNLYNNVNNLKFIIKNIYEKINI